MFDWTGLISKADSSSTVWPSSRLRAAIGNNPLRLALPTAAETRVNRGDHEDR